MIFRKLVYLTLACCISSQSLATAIVNGDFSSCDYSGWQTDTDGGVSTANDFTIVGSSPTCAASINVDYQDTEAFIANTLYQQLDFSAASDSTFLLTMDFMVDSEFSSLVPDFIADYFAIGLVDGDGKFHDESGGLGFLAAGIIDGVESFNLSFELDNTFVNKTGWTLDFQLLLGADDDGFTDFGGSSLILNDVSLKEVRQQAVPAPATISFFAIGLIGLLLRQKTSLMASNHERGRGLNI